LYVCYEIFNFLNLQKWLFTDSERRDLEEWQGESQEEQSKNLWSSWSLTLSSNVPSVLIPTVLNAPCNCYYYYYHHHHHVLFYICLYFACNFILFYSSVTQKSGWGQLIAGFAMRTIILLSQVGLSPSKCFSRYDHLIYLTLNNLLNFFY